MPHREADMATQDAERGLENGVNGAGYLEQPTQNGHKSAADSNLATQTLNLTSEALKGLAYMAKPSIFRRQARSGKVRKTAYLDGLRGFAAFMVYLMHHTLWGHSNWAFGSWLESGYGYNGDYIWCALPIVRTFFTGGHLAVGLFLVLSGYVLSHKPLSLIHNGELMKLNDVMASSLFRRYFRLYIPLIVTTFISACTPAVLGIYPGFPPAVSFRAEIWEWYCTMKNYTFFFQTGGEPWMKYNPHTWSIPVEMRGSILIFTCILAFSRLTTKARLLAEAGMCFYLMYIVDGAYWSLFMMGMIICDVDYLNERGQLPDWIYKYKTYEKPFWWTIFALGLLIGGVPSHTAKLEVLRAQPGWYWASFLVPQAVFDPKWFFLFWGSTFVVLSVPRLPSIKKFFEHPFNLYLGRISFMLYLVHGPILWTIGDRLYAAAGYVQEGHSVRIPGWANRFPIPDVGPIGLELRYIVPQLFLIPFTLWVAELATTMIDDPSIKFAQWLYNLGLPQDGSVKDKEKRGSS